MLNAKEVLFMWDRSLGRRERDRAKRSRADEVALQADAAALRHAVLKAIAAGAPDPEGLAAAALTMDKTLGGARNG